jgi:penicillin amidase
VKTLAVRIAVVILLGAAVIAASSTAVMFWLWQGMPPPAHGQLELAELAKPVRIARDTFGVPHIEAASLADGFAALGFAHAQDRLWQMDLLRRHARGTLSEIFGSKTLPRDRLARTLGLAHDASSETERLPKSTRRLLDAYSHGVNRWIEEVRLLRQSRPFEVRWLGYELEDWSAEDTVAIVRYRAWTLSRTLSTSLLLQRLVDTIGLPSRGFFPLRSVDEEPRLVGSLYELGRIADAYAGGMGLNGPVGSLGFLVGARRTASGAPLLVNDSHLEFAIPPLAYAAHLRTPELELGGVTWPGVPVFWMGANRRVAFGQVALHASTSDLFDESLNPTDPHQYDRNGRWIKAEVREEQVVVRWGSDERFEVVSTRHGPLLGAALPHDPSARGYALRWTGHAKRSGIRGHLAMQTAQNWAEFRDALRSLPAPASTFLYADVDGNIGTQVAGQLPIRTRLQDGFLPTPGSTRYYDWRGFVAFDDLPSSFGDELPWLIVSSLRRDADFPEAVAWLWNDGAGGERIRARLKPNRRVTLTDAVAIQREQRSGRGTTLLKQLLEDTTGLTEHGARVRVLLLEWDGSTDIDSVGASVYHAFRQRLTQRLLRMRLADRVADLEPLLRNTGPAPGLLLASFLERVEEAESVQLLDEVLEETWSWLGVHVSSNPRKWAWGRVHQLRLIHSFETLGGVPQLVVGRSLGRGPFPAPGDADSVWAMHHGALPDTAGVGPVVRLAVDLADTDHMLLGLAGGQSGHPGAPHYDDALADWLQGQPRPLWMHAADIAYHERGVWELHPPPTEP